MSGNFIYRHHVEPRVKLHSEKNYSLFHWNTLMWPELLIRIWMSSRRSALMFVGTLMALETCLILGQVSHNLLYSTKKLLTDICRPGGRLTRKQLTSRPDHLWPELWKSMGKHAKLKEKPKWSEEKIHLENARKLRGISFIDLEDKEFKETIKSARKKLETSVALAMPCKIVKKNCGSGASNKAKTKLACILAADESTRLRMGNSIPHYHQDHIAGKRKFITAPQFGSYVYSYASSYENSCSKKQRWTRNGKNWRKFRRGIWQKSKVRNRWSMKRGRRAQKFILHH